MGVKKVFFRDFPGLLRHCYIKFFDLVMSYLPCKLNTLHWMKLECILINQSETNSV